VSASSLTLLFAKFLFSLPKNPSPAQSTNGDTVAEGYMLSFGVSLLPCRNLPRKLSTCTMLRQQQQVGFKI
jgi:hypothetical protein